MTCPEYRTQAILSNPLVKLLNNHFIIILRIVVLDDSFYYTVNMGVLLSYTL